MEGIPNQESFERSQLIDLLKTKGVEDPETKESLTSWTERQEQQAEAIGTIEARLDFEIARAQLYFDAGFIEEAIATLEDAHYVAEQEGIREYAEKILEKIKNIS